MKIDRQNRESGVTLIELVLALGLTGVVMAGVMGIARLGFQSLNSDFTSSMKTSNVASFNYIFNRDIKNSTGVIIASANPSPTALGGMCTTYQPGATNVRPLLTSYVQHTLSINSAEIPAGDSDHIRYYSTSHHDLHVGMPVTIMGLYPADFNLQSAKVTAVDVSDYSWFEVALPSASASTLRSLQTTSPGYSTDPQLNSISNGAGISISYIGYEVRNSQVSPGTSELDRLECLTLAAEGNQEITDVVVERFAMAPIANVDWHNAIKCTPTAPTTFDAAALEPQTCPLDMPIVMGQRSISALNPTYDGVTQTLILNNSGNAVSSILNGSSLHWQGLDSTLHAIVTSTLISNTGNTNTVKIECYDNRGPVNGVVACPAPGKQLVFMGAFTAYVTASSGANPLALNDVSELNVGMYSTDKPARVIQSISNFDVKLWNPPAVVPDSITFVSCAALSLRLPETGTENGKVLPAEILVVSRGLL